MDEADICFFLGLAGGLAVGHLSGLMHAAWRWMTAAERRRFFCPRSRRRHR